MRRRIGRAMKGVSPVSSELCVLNHRRQSLCPVPSALGFAVEQSSLTVDEEALWLCYQLVSPTSQSACNDARGATGEQGPCLESGVEGGGELPV